ncbi:DUF4189 domain-containing protein [Acinetobacter proteolyticus]|nr:DUF4189 domain-containing protein [Acinetobacter proteolyticus]WEI17691.1 DUF4189 domain-containing protein [Acinetobacter proteolyticus]
MNKFLKHLLCLGLLSSTGMAIANDSNPNSAGYHARHNASSVYYQGPNGAANQQQAAPQLPPQPTGYWVKTWGAIAPSPKGGVLGTAVGADSKGEAERLALSDCKKKGGQSCQVDLAYHNQCGVMVVGEKIFNTAHAASIEEASNLGLKQCQKESRNCQVYYSACTEPRFVEY